MRTRLFSARTLAALLFATVLGCDDTTGPSAEVRAVAGTYTATQFTTTQGGTTTNWLSAGASINVTLRTNGTMSGQLVVPGESNQNLEGTWTVRDGVVEMDHPNADTFMRDVDFEVEGNALVGDETFADDGGPVRVQVTLTKQ